MRSCPDDDELLAVATGEEVTVDIRGHLDSCSGCRRRLDQLQAEVSNLRAALDHVTLPPLSQDSLGDSPAQPRPPMIGKYLVLEVLGRGGQADVYRAIHTELGKEVVLKLGRRPAEPGGIGHDELRAEGRVLAELDHPHLARVQDLDLHEGHPFLVMEYVRGQTLQQYAERQRPTPQQAAILVAQLARALTAAHRRGIVHQDLKPKNVLVDESGRPRIIDFGMARLVHGWADPRQQPEGGTAAYMAPEQARGESESIDPHADIFALGGILYFLLVGAAPFQGHDRLEVLERAGRCEFDRQALRAARVPRRLEAICLRAMAAEVADRYHSADELAADLERFAGRRRRWLIGTASVAAVLLALLGGKALWPHPVPEPPIRPEAQLSEDSLQINVLRREHPSGMMPARRLAGRVPLREGDELQVQAPVPSGLHAALFLISSDREVTLLTDSASEDLLRYPSSPKEYAPLIGQAGTEVLLVCWRRSGPIPVEDVRPIVEEITPLPVLPDMSLLRLDLDRVELVQRDRRLGAPRTRSDPEGDVMARLKTLQDRLRGRVDFLVGIAFAHTTATPD
jgi:serine/threonine protein kinase